VLDLYPAIILLAKSSSNPHGLWLAWLDCDCAILLRPVSVRPLSLNNMVVLLHIVLEQLKITGRQKDYHVLKTVAPPET
jgi:hypothetical protein